MLRQYGVAVFASVAVDGLREVPLHAEFGGEVAGHADILLVPNLEAGNFLFKQMVYFMSATAAGLVLGARVPIILTSRADPLEARLASCALASIFIDYRRQLGDRLLAAG